jgi:hypothetical protein
MLRALVSQLEKVARCGACERAKRTFNEGDVST